MLSEILKGKRVILASKSPRRQELLKGLDIPFEIITKAVDESYPNHIATRKIAEFLSEKKAAAFDDVMDVDVILITADTIVVSNNLVLEKPYNSEEAFKMINTLSGQSHEVITGVTVRSSEKLITFSASTKVEFKTLTETEIEYYIKTYQPYDKAGSYGIQEWIGYIGIPRIEGSYFNVMGLPVYELNEVLSKF